VVGENEDDENRNGWDAKEVVELVDVKMVGIDAGPL
jgi:hypothetical protein